VVKDWIDANTAWLHYAAPAAGAIFVVMVGKLLAKRYEAEAPIVLDDLAARDPQPTTGAVPGSPPK
jgi:hypothetical protein